MGLQRVTLEVLVFDCIEAWQVLNAVEVGDGESCEDRFIIHESKGLSDTLEKFKEVKV